MKLQNLFVATAILATTVVGGTTFAAEEAAEEASVNTVTIQKGDKSIESAPSFTTTTKVNADTATDGLTFENEGDKTVDFSDFTGDNGLVLTATQTTAFKEGEKALEAALTYKVAATATSGMAKTALKTTELTAFEVGKAQKIIDVKDLSAYGTWSLNVEEVTAEFTENPVILPGAYTSTVNWNLTVAPEAPEA